MWFLLDGMPVHFYHYVKWFIDSLPTLMDGTKWQGFVASVIPESYSCKLLPGDLYEQLQKHEHAG